jgi:glycosyltransferase involved in cell wall biosynthesis
MKLSVCIATIPERAEMFSALLDVLGRNYTLWQLIIDDRPRGTVSIGAKRQAMVEECTGDYIVHLDDDDIVPPDYIATILKALESNPDCVGHFELVEGHGPIPLIAKWTKDAPGWVSGAQAMRQKVAYLRTPFHKTPIRADIVRAIGFKDMHFGEDKDFSDRLRQARLIKTEVFIPRVLYTYRYTHEDHNTKYGIA